MPFLIRDDDPKTAGYSKVDRLPQVRGVSLAFRIEGQSTAARRESYVPWALTLHDKVVYCPYGQHNARPKGASLRPYDSVTSRERRTAAESVLGMLALRQRQYTKEALAKVSHYLKCGLERQPADRLKPWCQTHVAKYLYGTEFNFGRLGTAAPAAAGSVYAVVLDVLAKPANYDLQTVMAVHDAVGIKVVGGVRILPPDLPNWVRWTPESAKWNQYWDALRPADTFGENVRGRVEKPKGAYEKTTVPGTLPASATHGLGAVNQERVRGVDKYVPLLAPDPKLPKVLPTKSSVTFGKSLEAKDGRGVPQYAQVRAPDYYRDLDDRNQLFGAGPSGTTGTLLATGLTFGLDGKTDLLKQYLLAVIGYLVGGGMHCVHESLTAAKLAGIPYPRPGAFSDWLPQAFLASQDYLAWNTEYYDIVTLGSMHWMFNANGGGAEPKPGSVKDTAAVLVSQLKFKPPLPK